MTETAQATASDLTTPRGTFPRGRARWKEGDGTILVSRRRRDSGCEIYRQGVGVLALLYVGSPRRWLRRLEPSGLVLRHLKADGEGIFYLREDPRLADLLPEFSRGKGGGKPFPKGAHANG